MNLRKTIFSINSKEFADDSISNELIKIWKNLGLKVFKEHWGLVIPDRKLVYRFEEI